ncbi:DUF6599 family protein [Planctomycetota bacterium]
MSMVPSRNRRFEALTSIFLLLVLFLIGLGILIRQSDVNLARFGIYSTNLSPQMPTTAAQQASILESVIPNDFASLSEIEKYNPDNLYEKINGKAPLYLDSGFVELTAQRFVSKNDENLWMEIEVFDMANLWNAFSIFSVQRRPDADILSLFNPSYGYKTTNALYFVHGKYYIELIGSSESDELSRALTAIAQNIQANLVIDKTAEIPQLSLFPQENLIQGTTKLYLKNAFGFEGLTDVFACRYQINDEAIMVFLSEYNDLQTASANSNSYYKFLIENGAKDKAASSQTLKDNPQVNVLDFYGTTEIVFAAGQFIGGIHEADNQDSAEDLAGRLFEKLSQQAATK